MDLGGLAVAAIAVALVAWTPERRAKDAVETAQASAR